MATWVHDEDPDLDHSSNWVKKVRDHTGMLPRYACITYDFHDNPFRDAEWNEGVKKLRDRGMIVGVYNFFANPSGGDWNDPCQIEKIWAPDENAIKANFLRATRQDGGQSAMAERSKDPVVYTPFVESDDQNKWHAKQGSQSIIQLYRLVHDYFELTKGLDNIIWAYHTTQHDGALERCYPGDEYVDVLGKSAYGRAWCFRNTNGRSRRKASRKGDLVGGTGIRGIAGNLTPPRLPGCAPQAGSSRFPNWRLRLLERCRFLQRGRKPQRAGIHDSFENYHSG